jgi:peptide/nickel transport system ATP-binding protein/oligopeptide transport system ATP-binding protein
LDVTIQAQILELLKKLQKEYNSAIIMITHDLGVVAETCDYVAVMYAGKIVEYTTVDDLFDNPLHPYTKGLLMSMPRADEDREELYAIDGTVPSPDNLPAGCSFAPRCPLARDICRREMPELFEQASGSKVRCFAYSEKWKGEPIEHSDENTAIGSH